MKVPLLRHFSFVWQQMRTCLFETESHPVDERSKLERSEQQSCLPCRSSKSEDRSRVHKNRSALPALFIASINTTEFR
jgi:hypothetical protein